MNKIFKSIIALMVVIVTTCCAEERFPVFKPGEDDSKTETEAPGDSGQENPEEGEVPVPGLPSLSAVNYSKLTAENHPRLIFNDADFTAIKSNTVSSPVFKTFHDQIVRKAGSFVGASDLKRVLSGKRMLDVSRNALERLAFCAYAYKTTGEAKYLTQAEHDLLTVCAFQDWNARQHFLDVGEMAAGVALAYDWLYAELDADTKTKVRKALEDFAFNPANNRVWNLNFYAAENNWNQVCNGGLICAALAIYENSTEAKNIIEKGIESNLPAMAAMYSPDGNYPEGYSYWCYGTIYQALILTALETATGSDTGLSNVSGFSSTGRYMLFMEGYLGMCFNYSDSTPPALPCFAQWYFAHKYNDLANLYIEKGRLDKYGSAAESRLLPLVAYYAYKLNIASLESITAPAEKIYRGNGTTPVVLVHDNWAMDATDKFLGIKGGKANTSHGHMDAGSFVYEAYGVRWADDMSRPSYGVLEGQGVDLWNMNDGSERWTIKQYNNMNHNTLTINDKYHKVGGLATIKGTVNAANRKGGIVDITPALGSEVASAVRTIYIEGDDLVVTDEIKAKDGADAKVQWTLVTKAVPSKYGSTLELKNGSKYMYMKKSSDTGHNPAWWFSERPVESSYYECGYNITVKKGTTAKITIRLTPNE